MLDVQLKEHTRFAHAKLEKKMLRRIHEVQNAGDYHNLLTILYGFYSAIESAIHPWFAGRGERDFDRRRKAWRILDDMRALGGRTQAPALCTALPRVDGYHAALGAMYVTEGSTLGGPVIARLLQARLNSDRGMSFFLAYGPESGAMWSAFRKILDGPFNEKQRRNILDSAQETFLRFDDWLSIHD